MKIEKKPMNLLENTPLNKCSDDIGIKRPYSMYEAIKEHIDFPDKLYLHIKTILTPTQSELFEELKIINNTLQPPK